jgi:hypothetical protein
MNTWIQYGRGKIIKRYVRDRVTIKMIFALTGWYSNVLHDVVVGIATPAMEKILSGIPLYYYGVRHRLARHVTKGVYVTGTSIIWMSKRVHAG